MKTRNAAAHRTLTFPLAVIFLFGATGVAALEPPHSGGNAGAESEWYLCESERNPAAGPFACLRYRVDGRTHVLLYQGGPAPRAIRADDGARHRADERWLSAQERVALRHALPRPPAVPHAAHYRGTGVCSDERERPLPCSLFEYAGARQPEAMRYFVFYEPDGGGVRRVDALSAGRNEHALEAELAYQLGRTLTRSDCCREQARAWFAHAVTLFPDEPDYRAALSVLDRPPSGGAAATEPAGAAEAALVTSQ